MPESFGPLIRSLQVAEVPRHRIFQLLLAQGAPEAAFRTLRPLMDLWDCRQALGTGLEDPTTFEGLERLRRLLELSWESLWISAAIGGLEEPSLGQLRELLQQAPPTDLTLSLRSQEPSERVWDLFIPPRESPLSLEIMASYSDRNAVHLGELHLGGLCFSRLGEFGASLTLRNCHGTLVCDHLETSSEFTLDGDVGAELGHSYCRYISRILPGFGSLRVWEPRGPLAWKQGELGPEVFDMSPDPPEHLPSPSPLRRRNGRPWLPPGAEADFLELAGLRGLQALARELRVRWLDVRECPSLSRAGSAMIRYQAHLSDLPALKRIRGPWSVFGPLYLVHCPSLEALPDPLWVQGNLWIVDCPSLRSLPTRLRVEGHLVVDHCPGVPTHLPPGAQVQGQVHFH